MASDLPSLRSVGVYERTVQASLERVWENVHDWEHLPWLHASSFRAIALEDRGAWGWRARISPRQGAEFRLELVAERDRYVSRTLDGSGAGSEIWTDLAPAGDQRTDVRVEFLLPGVSEASAPKLGAALRTLYARLWDEDEAMMRRRASMLVGRRPAAGPPVDLGPEPEVRARAPFVVDAPFGRFRVVDLRGELVAHATVCPHWLGPLEDCAVEDGQVTCPWHGYRFDVRSGARRDATSRMRLPPAPCVVVEAGRARLEAPGGA